MEESKDRPCIWTRLHDTTGQCHYETECGKQVFAPRQLEAGDPEYCYGCGRRVDLAEDCSIR